MREISQSRHFYYKNKKGGVKKTQSRSKGTSYCQFCKQGNFQSEKFISIFSKSGLKGTISSSEQLIGWEERLVSILIKLMRGRLLLTVDCKFSYEFQSMEERIEREGNKRIALMKHQMTPFFLLALILPGDSYSDMILWLAHT